MFTPKKFIALVTGSVLFLSIIPFLAKAVRTGVSRNFPVYMNHGKPDLTVDPKRFVSQMEIVDRFFDSSSCELPATQWLWLKDESHQGRTGQVGAKKRDVLNFARARQRFAS